MKSPEISISSPPRPLSPPLYPPPFPDVEITNKQMMIHLLFSKIVRLFLKLEFFLFFWNDLDLGLNASNTKI